MKTRFPLLYTPFPTSSSSSSQKTSQGGGCSWGAMRKPILCCVGGVNQKGGHESSVGIVNYNFKGHGAMMGHSAKFLNSLRCLSPKSAITGPCQQYISHFCASSQPIIPSLAPVMVLLLALIPNLSIWGGNLDHSGKPGVFAVQRCESPPRVEEKVHPYLLATAESQMYFGRSYCYGEILISFCSIP